MYGNGWTRKQQVLKDRKQPDWNVKHYKELVKDESSDRLSLQQRHKSERSEEDESQAETVSEMWHICRCALLKWPHLVCAKTPHWWKKHGSTCCIWSSWHCFFFFKEMHANKLSSNCTCWKWMLKSRTMKFTAKIWLKSLSSIRLFLDQIRKLLLRFVLHVD